MLDSGDGPLPTALLADPHPCFFKLCLFGHPVAKLFFDAILAGLIVREDFFEEVFPQRTLRLGIVVVIDATMDPALWCEWHRFATHNIHKTIAKDQNVRCAFAGIHPRWRLPMLACR